MEYVQLFAYGAFVNGTWNGIVKQLIEEVFFNSNILLQWNLINVA